MEKDQRDEAIRQIKLRMAKEAGRMFEKYDTPESMHQILLEILNHALTDQILPPELCDRINYPAGKYFDNPEPRDMPHHLTAFYNYAYQKAMRFRDQDSKLPPLPDRPHGQLPHEGLQRLAKWFGDQARPPLGKIAILIYEKLITLPEYQAMDIQEISNYLDDILDEVPPDNDTLRKRHLPQLEPYGLDHKKRIGYRILKNFL